VRHSWVNTAEKGLVEQRNVAEKVGGSNKSWDCDWAPLEDQSESDKCRATKTQRDA
jgi:hypothetical protein